MPQQPDLLSILGVFAEPLVDITQFVRFIGKERLKGSDLLSYLLEEKMAEVLPQVEAQIRAEQAKEAQREAQIAVEKAQRETRLEHYEFQQALIAVIGKRFPHAPLTLMDDIRQIAQPAKLRELIVSTVDATDLDEVTRLLKQAADTQRAHTTTTGNS